MAHMERNLSFNISTKDLTHKSCFMKKVSNNDRVKESYYYGNDQDDGLMCWPPRCYTCSFCKREFKSAQALGGHMNVHRRDRAKLLMRHHSPPPLPTDKYRYSLPNLNNLEPNTNPSPISSSPPSPSRRFSHYSSGGGGNSHEIMRKYWGKGVVQNNDHLKSTSAKALFGVEKLGSFCKQENEFVRLDLEVGLLTESKQDLDLELRLGYT